MAADKVCEVSTEAITTSSHVANEAIADDPQAATTDTTGGVIPGNDQFVLFDSEDEQSLVDENCNNLLTDEALHTKAVQLRDVMNPNGLDWSLNKLGGGWGFDTQKVVDLIGGLRQGDLERLAPIFEGLDNTDNLLVDLQAKLPSEVFAELEMKLRETSQGDNIAGVVNLALVMAQRGQVEDAGDQIRSAFITASEADIQRAQEDWNRSYASRYGDLDLFKAIEASKLTELDKDLMSGFYNEGVENRNAEDVLVAARTAMTSVTYGHVSQDYGIDVFQYVSGSDTDVNNEAREKYFGDANFTNMYEGAFKGHKYADAYLHDGKLTTREILQDFRDGTLLFTDLDQAIDTSVNNMSVEDRQRYMLGRELAASTDQTALSAEQQDALKFYTDIHEDLVALGREDRAARWNDMIVGGEIVSNLVDQRRNSTLTDQSMKVALMGMSEADWNRLHTEDGGKSAYYKELETVLTRFAMSVEGQTSLPQLLEEIANAPAFDQIQVARGDFMTELTANAGPDGDPFKLADAIANMPPELAQKYKDDPAFRAQLDEMVFAPNAQNISDYYYDGAAAKAAALYGQLMLKQVAETGLPPVDGEIETLVRRVMNSELTNPDEQKMALLTIFRDPENLQALRNYFDNPDTSLFEHNLYWLGDSIDSGSSLNSLYEGIGVNVGSGIANENPVIGYTSHSQMTELQKNNLEEYNRLYNSMNPEMQAIQDAINAQNGVTNPVDYARMYEIGDESGRHGSFGKDSYRDTIDYLASLDDAGREAFMAEYLDKYKVPFGEKFMEMARAEATDPRYLDVINEIAANGFDIELEDSIRLAVLDRNDNIAPFEKALAEMSIEEITTMMSTYEAKYESDLSGDLLGLTGANYADSIMLSSLLSGQGSALDNFIDRTLNYSRYGLEVDGTHSQVISAFQNNRELLEQFATIKDQLPPEALAAVDEYFRQALVSNLTTKDNMAAVAQAAIDTVVMAATIASVFSGPIGAAALAGVVGTSLGRGAMVKFVKGEALTAEEESALGLHSTIDIAGSVGINLFLNSARAGYLAYKGGGVTANQAIKESGESVAAALAAKEGGAVERTAAALPVESTTNAPLVENVINATPGDSLVAREIMGAETLSPNPVVETLVSGPGDSLVAKGLTEAETLAPNQVATIINGTPGDSLFAREIMGTDTLVAEGAEAGTKAETLAPNTAITNNTSITADALAQGDSLAGTVPEKTIVADAVEHTDGLPVGSSVDDSLKQVTDPAALGITNGDSIVTVGGKRYIVKADGTRVEMPASANDNLIAANGTKTELPIAANDNMLGPNLAQDTGFLGANGRKIVAGLTDVVEGGTAALRSIPGRLASLTDNTAAAISAGVHSTAEGTEAALKALRLRAASAVENTGEVLAGVNPRYLSIPTIITNNAADINEQIEQLNFEPQIEAPIVNTTPIPGDQIKALATVQRGEGPWHSAERILAASGAEYGVDEIRALVKAMKAVYAQDNGSDDMSGLKVNYNFVTNDNFDNLLEAVDNPAVEAALKGFAMAN